MPNTITCEYCGNNYTAYKKGRSHCRNEKCRKMEIDRQVDNFKDFVDVFLRNEIKSTIEIRLAGNDKLSREAKVESISNLSSKDNKSHKTEIISGIQLNGVLNFLRSFLWKEIKGNFIIKTLSDGTIHPDIKSQIFPSISEPLIVGNNMMILSGSAKTTISRR